MIHFYMTPTFLLPDPNTQILYACDSCGDKFLDASSLAQHVRIHTAQALVMFQADSDFYQYTTTATTEGDTTTTWQPTPEQVIQGGELIFRTQDAEGGAKESEGVEETQEEGEEGGGEEEEVAQADTLSEVKNETIDSGEGEEMDCQD